MSLITKSDIQEYVELSDNLSSTKIDGYVKRAQELDLKMMIGAAFYKAFIDGVEAETAMYLTLLNGEEYTYCDDTIDFPGLKPVMAWLTYAQYLHDDSTISTINGIVEATSDHSQRPSEKTITRKIAQARENASHYMDEAHQYLCEKDEIYTLYKGSQSPIRRGKTNITSIG